VPGVVAREIHAATALRSRRRWSTRTAPNSPRTRSRRRTSGRRATPLSRRARPDAGAHRRVG
jgi:hypothetical protein